MSNQKIQFDMVADASSLTSASKAATASLNDVKSASEAASGGLGKLSKEADNASSTWQKKAAEFHDLYAAMDKVPSKEISAQLDELGKKFVSLGDAAAKGNRVAIDAMRQTLAEAKRLVMSDALKLPEPQQPGGIFGRLLAGFKNAKSTLSGGAEEAAGAMKQLSSIIGVGTAALGAFAAVLAGGKMFKDSVQATLSLNTEVAALARRLGSTTEEASRLNVALKLVGGDANDYADAVTHLNRKVRENEEAMNKMGVTTRDANGHYLDQKTVMDNALRVMQSYREGTDRNLAAQALFGKGADDVTKLLKINADTMARADELMKAYGLTVGADGVAATKQYKETMAELGLAFTGIENAIGSAVLPILNSIGKWFTGEGVPVVRAFIEVIQFLGEGFKIEFDAIADVVKEAWSAVSEIFDEWKAMIADLCKAIGIDMPENFSLWQTALKVFKGVMILWGAAVKTVIGIVATGIRLLMERFQMLARMAIAAFHLDWDGVVSAWKEGMARIGNTVHNELERIKNEVSETKRKLLELDNPSAPAQAEEGSKPRGGGRDFVDYAHQKKGHHGGGGKKSRMAEWENELNQLKLAHERENAQNGAFIEFSKQRERDFWKARLDTVKMSNEERYAVESKYLAAVHDINKKSFEARIAQQKETLAELDKNYRAQLVIAENIMKQMARAYGEDSKEFADAQKAKVEIQKRYNEQQRQLADLAVADRRAQAQADVDAQRELSSLKLNLGLATQLETLQQERVYAQRLYELQRQAIAERLALADPERDPVAHQQLLNQLLEMDRKYALEKQKLESRITAERTSPVRGVFDSMEQSFAKATAGILTRANTLRNGLNQIWKQLAQTFIEQMVTKPLAAYAAGLAKKLVFGQAAASAEIALDTTTATTKMATSSATAMATGTNNAVVAGTGAASALASIPIVGPALAAIAGPSMIALVMGLLGSIRSAEGGFSIPSGLNPLTQLHENEMVLPAVYANPLRRALVDGNGAGIGGPGGIGGANGGTHNHYYTVSALDARGVERVLRNNQDAFARAGRAIARTNRGRK